LPFRYLNQLVKLLTKVMAINDNLILIDEKRTDYKSRVYEEE